MLLSTEFAALKTKLEAMSLERRLEIPRALDFCSNDYLGFSTSEALRASFQEKIKNFPLGSTGSRLINGQSQVYVDLENALAERSRAEMALVFPNAYMANLALFGALGKMKAHFFSDSRNHASIIDGMRLSGATKTIFPHSDLDALSLALESAPLGKLKFVVVESIYSMGGDLAPLEDLLRVCEKFDAHLIVDEAHATGFFGDRGSGLGEALAQRIFCRVHAAGKALGVAGAWVSGSQNLKDLMVNFSRPLIYSTGMSYPQLLLLESALEYWDKAGSQACEQAQKKLSLLRSLLKLPQEETSTDFEGEEQPCSPVIPLLIGSNDKTLNVEAKLLQLGFHVKAIRPPTVPAGEGLLRLTVPGQRLESEVSAFAEAVGRVLKEVNL